MRSTNRPSGSKSTLFFLLAFQLIAAIARAAILPHTALPPSHSTVLLTTSNKHVASFTNFARRSDATSAPVSATVDAASAASIDASASIESSRSASTPIVLIPSTVKDYKTLVSMASALGPMATASSFDVSASQNERRDAKSRNPVEILAHLMPPPPPSINFTNSHLSKRQSGAVRVMIVGDSMTQGSEGDYTWRYRIWEWFRDQRIPVEFVGPYTGTQSAAKPAPPQPPPLYGSTASGNPGLNIDGRYALDVDPNFSGRHFSIWGRAVAVDQHLINQVLTDNPADMLLVMLGFNDVGWFYSDAYGTIISMENFIANARAANPNIQIALANIPQRRWLGRQDLPDKTNTYNILLANNIQSWSTPQSPVKLVHLQENYDCNIDNCPAGYDGLHPNGLGDYQIARAFSLTLNCDFGFGSGPLAIPGSIPVKAVPIPNNINVYASPGGITGTWDPVFGAYGYGFRSRLPDFSEEWIEGSSNAPRFDISWTLPGVRYEVQIRTLAGDRVGDWSGSFFAIANPQTASGPTNVVVTPTSNGVTITWDPPTDQYASSIFEYNLIYWDLDTPCAFLGGAGFTKSPAQLVDLNVNHRYLLAIASWNTAGGGFPEIVRTARIGAGTPPVPGAVQVTAINAAAAHLTWATDDNAAGYLILTRNVSSHEPVALVEGGFGCQDGYYLFPGVENWEYCVSGFNGNAASGFSNCVSTPRPAPGSPDGPTCPPPAPWCPGFGDTTQPPAVDGTTCEDIHGNFQQSCPPITVSSGSCGATARPTTSYTTTAVVTGSDGGVTTTTVVVAPIVTTDSQGHTITSTSTIADPNNAGDATSIIEVGPSIWVGAQPTIGCMPPCTFVLPPFTLPTPTIITPSPYTTSFSEIYPSSSTTTLLEGTVVTSTAYYTSFKTTVVTIVPVTTNIITMSNVVYTTVGSGTIGVLGSILLPPQTLTETNVPTGVDPITYTIFPPPFGPRFTTTEAHSTSTLWPFISVTSGKPSPTCTADCGTICSSDCGSDDDNDNDDGSGKSGSHGCRNLFGIGCGCIGLGCNGCKINCAGGFGNNCLGDRCIDTPQPPPTGSEGDPDDECSEEVTATDVSYYISYYGAGTATSTTTYSTWSSVVTGCSVTPYTSTTATGGTVPQVTAPTVDEDGSLEEQGTSQDVADVSAYIDSLSSAWASASASEVAGGSPPSSTTSPSSSPVQPPESALPTTSPGASAQAWCYNDHQDYKPAGDQITPDQWQAALNNFCNDNDDHILDASDPNSSFYRQVAGQDPRSVRFFGKWANNQNGCDPKSNLDLKSFTCKSAFDSLYKACAPNANVPMHGAFGVLSTNGNGCIALNFTGLF